MGNEPVIFWFFHLFSLFTTELQWLPMNLELIKAFLSVFLTMSHSVTCVLIELIIPVTKHAHK
jgi:hypothetical protein